VDQTSGRRCSCTDPGKLEYHHTKPYAMGGDHGADGVELRCTAHNAYQAELDFGLETMDRHRSGASRAREPAARYAPRPRAPCSASQGRVRRSRRSASPSRLAGDGARRGAADRRRPSRRSGHAAVPCTPLALRAPAVLTASPARQQPTRDLQLVASLLPPGGWGLGRHARRVGECAARAVNSITCGLSDRHWP
jgi:hypothetical protein